tara:strand:+ start:696 stop:1580 length:885 start_codon:yes stop_codon:yes gene_type:complete
LKDFKAIFKTYVGKTKNSIGIKKQFGDKFIHGGYNENSDWFYERMFFSKISSLNFLNEFLNSRNFSSVLEIGCSTGLLPKFMMKNFPNLEYTGIDLSPQSLELAKQNFKPGNYISGDFLKMNIDDDYELIISLDVVDHVYDPDAFIEKIIFKTKKYGFIRAYRGFFDKIDDHEMEYRENEGIYLNNLSVKKIQKILEKNNITKFQLLKHKSRQKNFYDSDLGRKWKRSSISERKEILAITGLDEKTMNNLPTGFEIYDEVVNKLKNIISSTFLDLPDAYDNISKPEHLVIIFEK